MTPFAPRLRRLECMRNFRIVLLAVTPLVLAIAITPKPFLWELGARLRHDSSILKQTADGDWRDAEARVQFRLHEDWSVLSARRWGKGETTVLFHDQHHEDTRAALYYRVETEVKMRTPEQAETSLLRELESKVAQRRRQGLPDYQPRPHSRYQVAGHEAISWVADFTVAGEPMVEVCSLIQSERMTALFFSKLPAAGLKHFQEGFAPTVASLRIQ